MGKVWDILDIMQALQSIPCDVYNDRGHLRTFAECWSCLSSFHWKEKKQLRTSLSIEMTLPLGMRKIFFKRCSIPLSSICSEKFLLIAFRATGTGILVSNELISKDY